jgi:hypothetical protein
MLVPVVLVVRRRASDCKVCPGEVVGCEEAKTRKEREWMRMRNSFEFL